MNKDKLQQLANIATIRQHISYLTNQMGVNRNDIKTMQQEIKKLDVEFTELLTETCDNERTDFSVRIKTHPDTSECNMPIILDDSLPPTRKLRKNNKVNKSENPEQK